MFHSYLAPELSAVTSEGFAHLMFLVMSLRPRGLLWICIPDRTWLWSDRQSSMRTKNEPWGDPDSLDVQASNMILARLLLVATVGFAKGCIAVVEMSGTSIAWRASRPYVTCFTSSHLRWSLCHMFHEFARLTSSHVRMFHEFARLTSSLWSLGRTCGIEAASAQDD